MNYMNVIMYVITSTMENLLPIIENISTYTLFIFSYFLYSTPDNTLRLSQHYFGVAQVPQRKRMSLELGFGH